MILYTIYGIILTLFIICVYKIYTFYRFCNKIYVGMILGKVDKDDPFNKMIKSRIIVKDIFKDTNNLMCVKFGFDEDNDGVEDQDITMTMIEFYYRLNSYKL